MVGVKTNVVTAVEIHGRHTNYSIVLPALAKNTARNFLVAEISADKDYASKSNAEAIAAPSPNLRFIIEDMDSTLLRLWWCCKNSSRLNWK
jgi:hypothetical protein